LNTWSLNLIEANGGSINAYTSFDYTVYHIVMPSAQWEIGLKVLAEMVKNALFDPQELASEKKVVLEEIRKNEDIPFSVLSDKLEKMKIFLFLSCLMHFWLPLISVILTAIL